MPKCRGEDYQYLRVDVAEDTDENGERLEDGLSKRHRSDRWATFWKTALLTSLALSIVALSGLVGFVLGRLPVNDLESERCQQTQQIHDDGPIKLDPVVVKFVSDRSFLQHPSNETEELWKTLYPEDTHGLFEYPDENPERSGFAAFHQLHCVDALRRGYYQADDVKRALVSGQEPPTFEQEVDETHTLHCIEFLRQSIMCHADATIQTEAVYHQGIMAFGVEYQCRNWWQLVDWVNERNRRS